MKSKRHLYYLLFDVIIVTLSFLFISALKPATLRYYLPNYFIPFLGFLFAWIIVSILNKKYLLLDKRRLRTQIAGILKTNFITLALLILVLYFFQQIHHSRFIVLGTIFLATFIEIFFTSLYVALIVKTPTYYDQEAELLAQKETPTDKDESSVIIHDTCEEESIDSEALTKLKKLIIEDSGESVYSFISGITNFCIEHCIVVATTTILNILILPNNTYTTIINLKKINNIRRINKFFEAVNKKLPNNSLFVCNVETYILRKKRILSNFPFFLNYIYYFFDYLFTRIFPKLPLAKQIYFYFTKGNKRVLSKAETLGRLYSCGFKVIDERFINERLYIIAIKIKEPAYDHHPTYGLFIKLRRLGKNGKVIKVYKIRTMHAYAEYLQDYVYEKNNLQEGGKFKDDFRRSTLGKFMRKYWIDELPSIINLIKGDVKLIGVRPLSPHYFSLYHEVLKQKRLKFKPGLIPPFYANLPKTLNDIMVSELKYLEEYEKHPFRTDTKYFFKIMYNIVFKNVRSN